MKKIFLVALVNALITPNYAAYIFYKGDSQPLTVEEYAIALGVLGKTEFTHVQRAKDVDPQIIAAHLKEDKKPFYEEELIQGALSVEGANLRVRYLPDTVAQIILVDHAKKEYFGKKDDFIRDPRKEGNTFSNELNTVVLTGLASYKNFQDLVHDGQAMGIEGLWKQHEDRFLSVVDKYAASAKFENMTMPFEQVKLMIMNMIKAEIMAQYNGTLLMVRASKPFEINDQLVFDNVYKDEDRESYGLSYNYSLFAAYFFDTGAATFKLATEYDSTSNTVLYTLMVPKTKKT